MSTYVAIIGTWAARPYDLDELGREFADRHPENPEDYVTLYEQRPDGVELRALELRTAEISRDDAFRHLRTELIDPRAARDLGANLRGKIEWDVKL